MCNGDAESTASRVNWLSSHVEQVECLVVLSLSPQDYRQIPRKLSSVQRQERIYYWNDRLMNIL